MICQKKFYIFSFAVCGVDLSGEKVIGRTPISEAEALSRMDEAHKEYLRKRIKEFAGA